MKANNTQDKLNLIKIYTDASFNEHTKEGNIAIEIKENTKTLHTYRITGLRLHNNSSKCFEKIGIIIAMALANHYEYKHVFIFNDNLTVVEDINKLLIELKDELLNIKTLQIGWFPNHIEEMFVVDFISRLDFKFSDDKENNKDLTDLKYEEIIIPEIYQIKIDNIQELLQFNALPLLNLLGKTGHTKTTQISFNYKYFYHKDKINKKLLSKEYLINKSNISLTKIIKKSVKFKEEYSIKKTSQININNPKNNDTKTNIEAIIKTEQITNNNSSEPIMEQKNGEVIIIYKNEIYDLEKLQSIDRQTLKVIAPSSLNSRQIDILYRFIKYDDYEKNNLDKFLNDLTYLCKKQKISSILYFLKLIYKERYLLLFKEYKFENGLEYYGNAILKKSHYRRGIPSLISCYNKNKDWPIPEILVNNLKNIIN